MTDISRIIEQVKALPPLPGTAIKLMAVINDPASTVDNLVEAIRYDQAVTTQVLKLCNSAHLGMARQVTSLNDAAVYLGTAKVLQLVMAVHTTGLLARKQTGYGLEPGVLWKHSVAVALASAEFAERIMLANTGLAYTAGLLHDIGKVVLNEHVSKEFVEIVRRVTAEKLSFVEAEEQVLGYSHEQVGGLLAENWQLPETIVRCIRHHHHPWTLDQPDPLVDTVYLANSLCLLLGLGLGSDGLYYRADDSVMERYSLSETDLETVGLAVMSELKRVEQMFDLKAPASPSAVAARQ